MVDTEFQCAVCGDPIPFADTLLQRGNPNLVCRSFDCQRLIKLKSQYHPAQYDAAVNFHRRQLQERRAREAAIQQHKQKIEQEEAEQDQALLTDLLAQQPALSDTPPEIIPLPQGLTATTADNADRIEKYREYLQGVIQQAFEYDSIRDIPSDQHMDAQEKMQQQDAMFEAQPALKALSTTLCTLCKGGCCPEGGDHAFIKTITIWRRIEADPSLTAEQILQEYLAYIPAQTISGGCINQTPSGCALPRGIRSDVCNSFFCVTLRNLQKQCQTQPPRHLFVVLRSNHNWNRYEAEAANPVVATHLIDVTQLDA